MSDLSNEERLDRLESAFQRKANDDAEAIDKLGARINEIIARISMLQGALQNEIAIQLANDTVENSEKYKRDFFTCFNNDWKETALRGLFLGGSEKREHELLCFLREIFEEFISRISYLEATLRGNQSGKSPTIPGNQSSAG